MRGICAWLLLTLYVSCSCPATQGSDQCNIRSDGLCITNDKFSGWDEARDYCIRLGGDLTVPRPGTKDIDILVSATDEQVWVGGRVSRARKTDNSSYYYGTWEGCAWENIDQDVDFRPSSSLSECLRSCSFSKYAYVKKSQCGCTNSFHSYQTFACDDPINWYGGEITGEKAHRFDVTLEHLTADESSCETVKSDYFSITREAKRCNKKYSGLCQSTNRPSVRDVVEYSNSFLWLVKNKYDWKSAERQCEQHGGSLTKLDWESPLLRETLYNKFGGSSLWLGVGPPRWRFIDGQLVSDIWPDVRQDGYNQCLVWEGSGLKAISGSRTSRTSVQLVPYHMTTTETTVTQEASTDPLGVSTTDERPTAITDTDPPSPQSADTKVSTHLPASGGDQVTSASMADVTLHANNPEMSTLALYIGLGVTSGMLVLCAVAVVIVWKVRRKSAQSGSTNGRLRKNQYNNNSGYDWPSASVLSMSEPGTNHHQTNVYINGNATNNFVEETYQSTLQAKTTSSDVGIRSSKGNRVNNGLDADLQPEEQYDKLAVPKASGWHRQPIPLYSVVSREDPTYVNCNVSTVTSPYDHAIGRRNPKANNSNYDELDIPNIKSRPPKAMDALSVYNHVSSDILSE